MRDRVPTVLLVVAAVLVLAGAIYTFERDGSAPHSSLSTGRQGAGTSGTSTAPVHARSSRTAKPRPVVTFLGDEYTAPHGFAAVVATKLDATVRAIGVAGAGYAKPGLAGTDYVAYAAAVAATHPDVVVVTGGRNDIADYVPTLSASAKQLFAVLHRALPHATLVAVAPFWGDSDAPSELTDVAGAVQAAVKAVGGTYLDLPDPLHGHPQDMANDADPNAAGLKAIARALEPRLATVLNP